MILRRSLRYLGGIKEREEMKKEVEVFRRIEEREEKGTKKER